MELPVGAGDVSFLQSVQNDSGAQTDFCPVDTDCFLWLKRQGHETNHSPSSRAESKDWAELHQLPNISSWCDA